MEYKTYIPDENLSSFVNCYWTLDIGRDPLPKKQRIVPDGCIEMIFHYGDLYRQYLADGSFMTQPRCFVFGQITETLEIEASGITGIFAVRFQPDGFAPICNVHLQEIENKAVELPYLFGEEGILLQNRILEAASNAYRIGIIEEFLNARFTSPISIDHLTKNCVEVLMNVNGHIQVNDLSEKTQIHRRQLERRFSETIGLSPKQLAKMLKIQAALKSLKGKHFNTLAELATENNYYDQAHFIKDFKEFTGMSPKQFYADNLQLTALFIGN